MPPPKIDALASSPLHRLLKHMTCKQVKFNSGWIPVNFNSYLDDQTGKESGQMA